MKTGCFSYLTQFIISIFGLSIVSCVHAASLTLECPAQEYVVTRVESDYYFIKGYSKITWQKKLKTVVNHGRFINPGKPKTLKLITQKTNVQLNDNGHGISLYCYLMNADGATVAFTITDTTLKELGIEGAIKSCNSQNDKVVCQI